VALSDAMTRLEPSGGQALASTTAVTSTNYIDLQTLRSIGEGQKLVWRFRVAQATTSTTAGHGLECRIVQTRTAPPSASTVIGDADTRVLGSTGNVLQPQWLTVGQVFYVPMAPVGEATLAGATAGQWQFVSAVYVKDAGLTNVKIECELVLAADGDPFAYATLPDGI
jgi:hypothetical protein